MSRPLEGKIALISGAGKNIGRAVAHFLAEDGAAIIVNGRGDTGALAAVVAEIHEKGGRAIAVQADVSKPEDVARLVETGVKEFGGLDIVVSNAGLRRQTPFLKISLAEWREIMSVALEGAFLLAQAATPHLIARGGGTIVAMSGVSNHVGTPERCHVSASKAGLEGLMRSLAIELAPHRITCNCISPGAIDTVRGAAAGVLPPGLGDQSIPARRKGTVEEIAGLVRHLAGPFGGYITGQTLHVNGGAFLT